MSSTFCRPGRAGHRRFARHRRRDRARTGPTRPEGHRHGNHRRGRGRGSPARFRRHAGCRGATLDVNDAQAAEALIDAIVKEHGGLHVLVNNAGITRDMLAMRLKDEDWDAVLDTNLKAVFRMSRAVMRTMMKQRYGRIISITSVVGSSGNPGQANYAAAKAGVAGHDPRAGARTRQPRHHRQLRGARLHRNRHDGRRCPKSSRRRCWARFRWATSASRRDIAHAVAFLASPAGRLRDGTGTARQRRHVHVLSNDQRRFIRPAGRAGQMPCGRLKSRIHSTTL